jgi:hypothetical protein
VGSSRAASARWEATDEQVVGGQHGGLA